MALTQKLFYISIFTSKKFRTQMRKERERERKKRSLVLSLTSSSTLSLMPNAADPLLHTPQKISTLLRKFLSSLTLIIHAKTKPKDRESYRRWSPIQSPTHGPVGLIALLKPITDLITPPQLLHRAQTHLQWTWSDRARLCLCHVISPSPSLCDLASRSNPFASLSSFFSQFDWIWWFFFLVLFLLCFSI